MRCFSLLLCLACSSAFATSPYIASIEGLLNSVGSRDATRPQLTLKLADAFFNEAVTLNAQIPVPETDQKTIAADRRRAVQLYIDSLGGLQGLFAKPTGPARSKIQFQLARIYNDQGNLRGAIEIWTELGRQDEVPEIQRESLLRLAEDFENRSDKGALSQAEIHYKKALGLCASQDVCSYVHYRLAWVYHRQNRADDSIREMDLALWDGKAQVREESLRDLITFLAGRLDDGKDALERMEQLSAKLVRPTLIQDLSDAYFAAGNKKAGVYVLSSINRKTPALKASVRLLEEVYGFRDWERFDRDLESTIALAEQSGAAPADAETEKILKRLTVQLDGERLSQPRLAAEFKRAVQFYLILFPERAERAQMVDGWLAAETNDDLKIRQLATWVDFEAKRGHLKEEIRLREMRAAVAQKNHQLPVVISEMMALEPLSSTPQQHIERSYQLAYAHYENKDFAAALPIFQKLAVVPTGAAAPDKWAIQSEHLALDILAQQKAFVEARKQAQLWTADPRFAKWLASRDHGDELRDIQNIERSAEFEWATSLGPQIEALDVYARDCEQNLFTPKSCDNAKVLAVQLNRQQTLIAVLKKLGKKDDLAAELEAAGEFVQAAQILETDLASRSTASPAFLKVALLYELGADNASRDRVLRNLMTRLNSEKSMGEVEPLLYQTFQELGLLNTAALRLAWSPENRTRLIDELELAGHGNAETRKSLVGSCADMGPAWQKMAMTELQRLDAAQSKIHFAGKNSKSKFQMRVAGLKQLVDRGGCYLQSTSPRMRVVMGTLLGRSQRALAEEILASPIPEGLDESAKASVQTALNEMAQPFAEKAKSFDELVQTQLQKIATSEERSELEQKIAARDEHLYEIHPPAPPVRPVVVVNPQPTHELLHAALAELRDKGSDRQSLEHLKHYYEAKGQPRLAAYFQGRLLQLEVRR